MARPRTSTAVLLTRGRGPELEVLLVLRAPGLAFFGGWWALPGGTVDDADAEDGAGLDDERALRRAALRELFEETGVLLDPWEEGRDALRRALVDDGRGGAAAWRARLDAAPDGLERLAPLGRLTTPPLFPVRHRTLFFHADLPVGESVDVWPGELEAARFVRPADALASWRSGELPLVPPAVFLLERLIDRPLPEALRAIPEEVAALEHGRLAAVRFVPGVDVLPLATPTIPPATTTNCVVLGSERAWIVDPAAWDAGERERLFAFLDGVLAEGRELAGVLVTHHHRDHVGAVAATRRRYGLPVRAHPLTLERLPLDARAAGDGDLPLRDGDVLELGTTPDGRPGWRLEALFTPGHDRGHLAFRESRYGTLVAGDLVSTLSTIVIDPPEGHLATYLASLRRARDAAPGTIVPAHGPPRRDGRALLEDYLDHRARRERRVSSALGAAPRTLAELLPEVYDDVAPEALPLAERSLLAGLEKLEEEGLAARRGAGWVAAP